MQRRIEFKIYDRNGQLIRFGAYNANNAFQRKRHGGMFAKAIDEGMMVVTGLIPLPSFSIGVQTNGEGQSS